jgi:hypothetical protein
VAVWEIRQPEAVERDASELRMGPLGPLRGAVAVFVGMAAGGAIRLV